MSFVAAATTVGGAIGLSGTAAIIGGGALIGAGVGGTYSALTGDGKILDSMLTGAGIGGLGAYGLSAAGVGGAAAGAAGTGAGTAGAAGATSSPAAFAYNAAGEMVPANYAAEITGATNLGSAANATNPSWWGSLSGGQKLATGLGATTLLGMLGGKQEGVNAPIDKGMIRPYEYNVEKRAAEPNRPYYFQPIEYDQYGRTTAPIDTSERNYFNQSYTPLPTYKAALGGQVPNLNNMPAGGLAAIQGRRDGYAPVTTMDGNIPQFASGGQAEESTDDLMAQYKKLRALNIQIEPKIAELADQKIKFQGGDAMPDRFILERMKAAQPDQMRNVGQPTMGMVEGSQMMDRMGRPQGDVGIMPLSVDPKNMAGIGTINKQLDDDTRLKLMASGYRNQMGSGIDRIGAGLTRQLGRDSDLSAFYERSPGTRDQMGGVRYSQRFNEGGMAEGDLGGYSDGGRLLRGPGDGVSDSIPATINDKQPARLADGEFVIPARIVSEIGNGSTDAGAKRLYDMMDKIQAGRKKTVGKGKVAVDTKAKKHLLA